MGERYCSTCHTTSNDFSPEGWYRIFVNDPDAERGARFFGLFCSTECLCAKLPEVAQLIGQIEALTAELAQARADVERYRTLLHAPVPPEPDDETRWLGTDGATYERHDGWKATEGDARRWYNTNSGGPDTWAEVWKAAQPSVPLVIAGSA